MAHADAACTKSPTCTNRLCWNDMGRRPPYAEAEKFKSICMLVSMNWVNICSIIDALRSDSSPFQLSLGGSNSLQFNMASIGEAFGDEQLFRAFIGDAINVDGTYYGSDDFEAAIFAILNGARCMYNDQCAPAEPMVNKPFN